ncbi:uncharacterized protein LOC124365218 [Homalodisca vitripennis]|uniref:uncharacterized protein LOC124365218 n=1 Tax=Homalodisca vitripennis TaxID=197043 RepID=UPI001EEAB818|nr:uncharacterized protein LOC124365218 [Homalodisca vitripennis]
MNWVREVKDQVVRNMMDRHFMLNQQIVVMGQHERKVNRRIEERELWEIEREKKLILGGRMGLEEAPYIADHPVFTVSKMANVILEEKKQAVEEKLKPKMNKTVDYDQMRSETGLEREDDQDSMIELDAEELERARKLWEIEQKIEEGQIFTQEEYEKIKYEAPLVKKLRSVESLAEMYQLAEEIVGPVVHNKNKKRQG